MMLSGCGQNSNIPSSQPLAVKGFHGVARGGQQPISGATVQMYAAGTAGDGSAATAMMSAPVTTDAGGYFTLTGLFTCPTPTSLVYLLASGGNPGLTAGTNNTSISLMAALGPCQNLSVATFVNMNEVTTVAAIAALAPYVTTPAAIGSGTADAAAIASAFTLASEYANTTTGGTPGNNVPAGMTVPTVEIDTLADIIANCINSSGGTAGDNSNCGDLFAYSTVSGGTAPTNVVSALLSIVNNPGSNISALLGLAGASAPFQPTLAVPPPSWAVALATSNPALTVSPASLNFADTMQSQSATAQSVTLTNPGAAAVSLSGISLMGANAGDYSMSSNCPNSLAAGGSCSITVGFAPTAAGPRYADIAIASATSTAATARRRAW
jgi:hypothetical protein